MSFAGRVALITGAGSGIGEATALAFSRQGARVALLGHTEDELEEVAEKIDDAGGEAMALVADIASEDDMQHAVERIESEWGRLDIVFANAGVNGVWAPIDDITPDEWRQTIDVNLNGTYITLHYTVPLLKRNGGSIIITSSINGTRRFTLAGATAYASTKAAQVAIAKMLAVELARHDIRVNVLCPGQIETSIDDNTDARNTEKARFPVEYPEGPFPLTGDEPANAEEVARLVLFLCSDQARFITGTPVWIDGGQSLIQ